MWTVAGWPVEVAMSLKRHLCCVALAVGVEMVRAGDGTGIAKWQALFNGKDLSGWVPMNGGVFAATNGGIHLEGGKGWLRTERMFTDFVLEAECRGLETNYNSGIFLRAPLDGNPWATNVWQVNLKQSALGELLEGSKKAVAVTARPRPAGEWIKFRIEVHGHAISLEMDGQPAWNFKEFVPVKGYLGLQAEGKAVEFRNLRIGELPIVEAPFPGRRLNQRP